MTSCLSAGSRMQDNTAGGGESFRLPVYFGDWLKRQMLRPTLGCLKHPVNSQRLVKSKQTASPAAFRK